MKMQTKTVSVYAQTVINQADQLYAGKRNDWDNPENAQNTANTYALGHYTKVKSTYKKPHVLYAYDFGASIPAEAVVTGLKFEVRMRKNSVSVKAPVGVYNWWDTKNRTQNVDSMAKTGWSNGAYRFAPSEKISSAYTNVEYTISDKNLKLYPQDKLTSLINSQGFGIQLRFHDAKSTGEVRVKWFKMTVTYVLPQRYITFDEMSLSSDNPTEIPIDVKRRLNITTGNISIASEQDRTYVFDLPLGFELVGSNASGDTINWDSSTLEWRVKGKAKAESNLYLDIIPHASGSKDLLAFRDDGVLDRAYFFVTSDRVANYDDILCTPNNMQRGELSCIDFIVKSSSSTSNYGFTVNIPDLLEEDVMSVSLIEGNTSETVTMNDYTVADGIVDVSLKVPVSQEFYFAIKICYIPRNQGVQDIVAETSNDIQKTFNVEIAAPYEKHIKFNTNDDGSCSEIITVTTNRLISQIEGDLDVLRIYTDEYDADMYVDETTLGLNQWTRTRYIGCVEVPYSHYDPKHTSKDKLLDEHYKNKEYIGKENAVDEDITLSIKVPRRKVPTLIGLVNIDRPIPVNLVPDAFEGDPLNHRGWAEIYGIEVTPTNPLYDTCEIDLKYITHNIISRFNIYHSGSANPFKLPNVYQNSLESGGDIGDFFDVMTDGSYVYDEDDINVHRNLFSLNNQQDVILRSKSPIASKSQFELYWDTVLFSELRENNIQRVVRLVDASDKVVFEYEYYDFDFTDDVYTCRVMGRVLTENGFNPIINKDIYIHSDVEYTENINDEEYDANDLDVYGSSVQFELNSNVLKILEKGFSDYEFEQTVTLQTGSYYLEVYWKNNNNDADTGNSINYFDFEINELVLDTKLSEYYNKLLVSPYPVPNKKIVFTRESEEGTIYYLENDGGEFNFLLEPFYQYKCGTDLVAEGSSIFDFNNSYPIIYIQNCLIRFGINRLNGDLYLDKWDNGSKQYIRTNRFRIDKFDDAEVSKINDDIIIVNVSDINITMWRGRPYVMLQHETEDIHILDKFTQVFADGVGDTALDYPAIHNLSNANNLLAECVGGTNLIKSSCITVTTEEDTGLIDLGDFLIYNDTTKGYVGEELIFTLNKPFADDTVSLVVNDEVAATNVGDTIITNLKTSGDNVIYAVYHGDDDTNIEVSNMLLISASNMQNQSANQNWKLECITTETSLKYNQGTVDFKLTLGENPIEGVMIEVYDPHQTWHIQTNSEGIVKAPNLKVPKGSHKWVATAYDDGIELDVACTKPLKIEMSTPQITGSTLSLKAGGNAGFRLVEESKRDGAYVPMENTSLDITIGGKKYVRTTSKVSSTTNGGYVAIKMSKKGTYTAKVKYAGEKNKYNSVTKSFTVEVK